MDGEEAGSTTGTRRAGKKERAEKMVKMVIDNVMAKGTNGRCNEEGPFGGKADAQVQLPQPAAFLDHT